MDLINYNMAKETTKEVVAPTGANNGKNDNSNA
jgi:hypothetical protein